MALTPARPSRTPWSMVVRVVWIRSSVLVRRSMPTRPPEPRSRMPLPSTVSTLRRALLASDLERALASARDTLSRRTSRSMSTFRPCRGYERSVTLGCTSTPGASPSFRGVKDPEVSRGHLFLDRVASRWIRAAAGVDLEETGVRLLTRRCAGAYQPRSLSLQKQPPRARIRGCSPPSQHHRARR